MRCSMTHRSRREHYIPWFCTLFPQPFLKRERSLVLLRDPCNLWKLFRSGPQCAFNPPPAPTHAVSHAYLLEGTIITVFDTAGLRVYTQSQIKQLFWYLCILFSICIYAKGVRERGNIWAMLLLRLVIWSRTIFMYPIDSWLSKILNVLSA